MTTRPNPRRMRRAVLPLAAAALAGGMLPVAAPGSPAHAADGDPAFSGYSGEAWAAPVRLEVYEPTLPIPANPQLEVFLGYSKVEADSSSGKGRASYLWPGDPVGEGLKTFMEQLGMPQAMVDPIAGQGYPVQVNSEFPGGPEKHADEPFPGAVMRSTAGEGTVVAKSGFSSDCEVDQPRSAGGGGTPGLPGLPGAPGLPGLPGLESLSGLGDRLTGRTGLRLPAAAGSSDAAAQDGAGASAEEEAAACQVPAPLAALVDVAGFSSTSRSVRTDDQVVTSSRASLGDVELFGGIVTLSGFQATATSTSDGKKGVAGGGTRLGTLTIAGQTFAVGPDGYEAVGQRGSIPGLPDDPAKALKALGLTLTVPKPVHTADGEAAVSQASALVVEVDTQVLSPVLSQLPIDQLLGPVPFPAEAAILKSLLTALPNLSPRLVLTLGTAATEVETVQGIELPELPTGDLPAATTDDAAGADDTGAGAGAAGSGSGGAAVPGAAPGAGDPGAAGAGGAGSPEAGQLPATAPAAAGLPPLFSIPGMLLIGGIALAAVAGTWLRKIGALALGGGVACPHGLDSGLPDLRKA